MLNRYHTVFLDVLHPFDCHISNLKTIVVNVLYYSYLKFENYC